MMVSGFRSYDEAYQYARQLFAAKDVVMQMSKTTKAVIISDKNLKLIGTTYSYKDYEAFYKKNFSPLEVTKRYLLSEPAEVATPHEPDLLQKIEEKHANDKDLFPDDMDVPANNTMDIPLDTPASKKMEPTTSPKNENTFEMPTEVKKPTLEDTNTFVIPDEKSAEKPTPALPKTPVNTAKETKKAETKPTPTQQKIEPKVQKVPSATPQKAPAKQPQQAPAKKPKTVDDGPIIYFGDDEPTSGKKNNNKTNKKNQPIQNNIEDEYYDLEGF